MIQEILLELFQEVECETIEDYAKISAEVINELSAKYIAKKADKASVKRFDKLIKGLDTKDEPKLSLRAFHALDVKDKYGRRNGN